MAFGACGCSVQIATSDVAEMEKRHFARQAWHLAHVDVLFKPQEMMLQKCRNVISSPRRCIRGKDEMVEAIFLRNKGSQM